MRPCLRDRKPNISYVEPDLKMKIRQVYSLGVVQSFVRWIALTPQMQGDYYGLGKLARKQTSRKPGKRQSSSAPAPGTTTSYLVTIYSPPTPGARPHRVTRRLKRISYEEPKLNTKLRQVRITFLALSMLRQLTGQSHPLTSLNVARAGRQVHVHDMKGIHLHPCSHYPALLGWLHFRPPRTHPLFPNPPSSCGPCRPPIRTRESLLRVLSELRDSPFTCFHYAVLNHDTISAGYFEVIRPLCCIAITIGVRLKEIGPFSDRRLVHSSTRAPALQPAPKPPQAPTNSVMGCVSSKPVRLRPLPDQNSLHNELTKAFYGAFLVFRSRILWALSQW